jgi:cytochrome b6-f complex iron-sulfur subunit
MITVTAMNETDPKPPNSPPTDGGRRRFCQAAIGGMTVVTVGTVGYPVATFLRLPKSMTAQEILELPLSDLPDGAAHWGELMGRQIVIIKVGEEVRAFDGACPHLGCVVQWEPASRSFLCPCHGATFDDRGQPTGGPVNNPLERVDFTVTDGVLKIA